MNEQNQNWKFATRAIHVGQEPDPTTGATVPPICATSTYTQASPGKHKGYEYSRSANPTRVGLERALASLEGGEAAASFASGSAATACVFATLSPGDKVVAYADCYGGTFRLLKRVFEGFGVVPVFTDDTSPHAFAKLIDAKTKLVWLESPTNPLLRCLDISAISRIAHDAGAKLAVDNTFATPALQLPLKLGADYVVHSTTKYIGGHSDVIGGAVIVKDKALMERIAFLQNAMGGVPGPFDCFLQHRGIKTLDIRMERHCANALAIAEHAQGHAKLSKVVYPFLEDHPDHALAKRQMCGGGGIVTIVFKGERSAALRFCENVKIFSLAESLGGVESLVCHPAIMTHASIPKEIREARGVTDGLVRLSVGIEDVADLIADLDQALAKA
ncbi:MAG: cystathionine gamma-synthase [Planctomycetes bacterium]|nr:cystathionine gamma-synthase [Planctomycetota bacterium]MBI3835626.1 cystathionine gamma-synthase [Planctomycetota bacterium]